MPTSTKMAIPYPSSTDLVKDGATNMGSMATQIDAKTGLVLISTTSFSAVSSQSFNDVFSANFDNYLAKITMTSFSADQTLSFRYRVGGTDLSASTYYAQAYSILNGAGISQYSNSATSSVTLMDTAAGTANNCFAKIEFMNPFAARINQFEFFRSYNKSATGFLAQGGSGSVLDNSTSYTGFSLITSTGNFTGICSIYGYNK
jgi:hypothetical protein